MSEHKHCWHQTNRHEGTVGVTVTRKCCHCGVIEQETYPPFKNKSYTFAPNVHGPFLPDVTTRWT